MERTVWIFSLALVLGAGAGCKDSNPNYISFDAQASDVPATDLKAATDGPTADVVVSHGADASSDTLHTTDAIVDSTLSTDVATDDAAVDSSTAGDTTGDGASDDGSQGQ